MILTTLKLFQEFMEFLDSESAITSGWSKEFLKDILDEKAKALTPKEAKNMTDEELEAYLEEIEQFASKLDEELTPYLKEKAKRMLYGFADKLTDILDR